MIFTGSTVVDARNTSGFCAGGKPCMVAVYTGHTPRTAARAALQTQNLAYSNDHGRTWTKYSGNPVLNLNLSDFRDPHVFWSEPGAAVGDGRRAAQRPQGAVLRLARPESLGAPERVRAGGRRGRTVGMPDPDGDSGGGQPAPDAVGAQGGAESRRLAGWIGRAVFRGQFRRHEIHQRQSGLDDALDRLRERLLLRPDVQRNAAERSTRHDRLDEQLAVCGEGPDRALARADDHPEAPRTAASAGGPPAGAGAR